MLLKIINAVFFLAFFFNSADSFAYKKSLKQAKLPKKIKLSLRKKKSLESRCSRYMRQINILNHKISQKSLEILTAGSKKKNVKSRRLDRKRKFLLNKFKVLSRRYTKLYDSLPFALKEHIPKNGHSPSLNKAIESLSGALKFPPAPKIPDPKMPEHKIPVINKMTKSSSELSSPTFIGDSVIYPISLNPLVGAKVIEKPFVFPEIPQENKKPIVFDSMILGDGDVNNNNNSASNGIVPDAVFQSVLLVQKREGSQDLLKGSDKVLGVSLSRKISLDEGAELDESFKSFYKKQSGVGDEDSDQKILKEQRDHVRSISSQKESKDKQFNHGQSPSLKEGDVVKNMLDIQKKDTSVEKSMEQVVLEQQMATQDVQLPEMNSNHEILNQVLQPQKSMENVLMIDKKSIPNLLAGEKNSIHDQSFYSFDRQSQFSRQKNLNESDSSSEESSISSSKSNDEEQEDPIDKGRKKPNDDRGCKMF